MKLLERPAAALTDEPPESPVLIIPEARRREKRRRLRAGFVALVVLGVAGTAVGVLGTGGDATHSTASRLPQNLPADAAEVLVHATLLLRPPGALPARLWPAGVGAPSSPNEQPVLAENLGTGHLAIRVLPGTERGGSRLSMLSVDGYLVYWTTHGVSALPGNLKGRVRLLGQATYVTPSATPGEVWLVRSHYPYTQTTIQSASVKSGRHGPLVTLPQRTDLLRGTDAGLLLAKRNGELELWRPGGVPRVVANDGTWPDHVFASGSGLLAFGSGCRNVAATPGDYEYTVCTTLRVVDLVTGRRLSFAQAPGTLGWVPPPTTDANLSSGGGKLAAEASMPPAQKDTTELFVLSLFGRRPSVTPVPSSNAHEYVRTAWSPDGSVLLYEGPHHRLDVFLPVNGKRYQSRLPWNGRSVSVVTVPRDER